MAKSKWELDLSPNNIITCAIYAVIGLLLAILQSGILGILITLFGALLIVLGIVDIVKNKDMVKGIIEAVAGVAVIVLGWLLLDIVILIFGIALIIKGVMDLVKDIKAGAGLVALISPIVTVLLGVLFVISDLWLATVINIICIVAGVIFIVNGVLALFGKSLRTVNK